MPWVPISDSGLQFDFDAVDPEIVSLVGSTATSFSENPSESSGFEILFEAPPRLRITSTGPYQAHSDFGVSIPAAFTYGEQSQTNEAPDFAIEFLPAQFELDLPETSDILQYASADASEWEVSDSYQFLIEVWEDAPPPPLPPETCKEIGRTTRAYVTAYSMSNSHQARVRRRAKRCVIANFNGAIPKGMSIAKVTWRTNHPWVCHMSNPSLVPLVTGAPLRQAQVDVDFDNPGIGHIKAEVTLDNGEIYMQLFEFSVWDSPLFDEPFSANTGPYNVTYIAP